MTPACVRRRQPVGDRRRRCVTASRHGKAPDFIRVAQRVALEQLHDRDGHAVDDRELVNREDARVRQRGDRPRLGLEPPPHLGIGRDVRRHHLDGDVAIEPRVAGAIHLAHAARADALDDLVLGEVRAWESVVTWSLRF